VSQAKKKSGAEREHLLDDAERRLHAITG